MVLALCGCAPGIPVTPGEAARQQGSYGYTPLDPLPIPVDPSIKAPLTVLPDITMRLAIGQFNSDGSVSFGPVKVGTEGNSYTVVLDYIQFTTLSIPVKLKPQTNSKGQNIIMATRVSADEQADTVIPVYIGVGLRLTANIVVISGNVNLANLAGLGAAAEAKNISGTLVIQSLGISGEGIASAIPIPSDINSTTIQNALMAIGTIKAKTYDSTTTITPRVVAVYNPFSSSGPDTISGFISTLLTDPDLVLRPNNGSVATERGEIWPKFPTTMPTTMPAS